MTPLPRPARTPGPCGAGRAVSAGLHLVTWLPPHLDEGTVVAAARRAGVGLDAVGQYRITSQGRGGLIFGYATVSERAIAEGITRLAAVTGRG